MSKEKKFEENLADLEAIVQKLESGDVALEEAITEFQKGMKLSNCLLYSISFFFLSHARSASVPSACMTLTKVFSA